MEVLHPANRTDHASSLTCPALTTRRNSVVGGSDEKNSENFDLNVDRLLLKYVGGSADPLYTVGRKSRKIFRRKSSTGLRTTSEEAEELVGGSTGGCDSCFSCCHAFSDPGRSILADTGGTPPSTRPTHSDSKPTEPFVKPPPHQPGGRGSERIFSQKNLLFLSFFLVTLLSSTDACSSRSTPKPRPPSPTMRPNITFQTYACPPAYAAWYCLNGATCFTVKIGISILYNCECADGFMGQRCEFKDLDGSYLPTRERLKMAVTQVRNAATSSPLGLIIVIVLVAIAAIVFTKRRTRAKLRRIEAERTEYSENGDSSQCSTEPPGDPSDRSPERFWRESESPSPPPSARRSIRGGTAVPSRPLRALSLPPNTTDVHHRPSSSSSSSSLMPKLTKFIRKPTAVHQSQSDVQLPSSMSPATAAGEVVLVATLPSSSSSSAIDASMPAEQQLRAFTTGASGRKTTRLENDDQRRSTGWSPTHQRRGDRSIGSSPIHQRRGDLQSTGSSPTHRAVMNNTLSFQLDHSFNQVDL